MRLINSYLTPTFPMLAVKPSTEQGRYGGYAGSDKWGHEILLVQS